MNSKDEPLKELGNPKWILAPMVDASELPFRMLCRKYGAELCYSPMLHSKIFSSNHKYRKNMFTTCPEDRPLVVQFCGNDVDVMVKAAKFVEKQCDFVDVNLGCPQHIAKRGKYGAFLQDEWQLLSHMVRKLRENLAVPISCKVRIFKDVEKTVNYAKMLEAAGCQLLTVHGRTREQIGPLTGLANWDYIKAVKAAVQIPVFANGNVQCLVDAERCMKEVGCDGVMSAEGALSNPALFSDILLPCWVLALEYVDLVSKYSCPSSYVRGHLFKIFRHLLRLEENADIRLIIAKGRILEDFREAVLKLKERYEGFHEGADIWKGFNEDNNLRLPPWICQPYVRMLPELYIEKMQNCSSCVDVDVNGGESLLQDIDMLQ